MTSHLDAIAESAKQDWHARWRFEYGIAINDQRARDVTGEQIQLDLVSRWAIQRAMGMTAPRVSSAESQTVGEWFDEQVAVNEERRLREKPERDRLVDELCEKVGAPTREEGNRSKEAAMQRLYALKGWLPGPTDHYQTCDLEAYDPLLDD